MNWKTALAFALVWLVTEPAQAQLFDNHYHWGYRVSDDTHYPIDFVSDDAPRAFVADFYAKFRVNKNPRGENVKLYLPLPANNRLYQRVLSYTLDPTPTRIIESRYGYKVAVFDFGPLGPEAPFRIHYHAEVELFQVKVPLNPALVGTLDEIPEPIRRDYTGDGPFYRLTDPSIQAAARKAVGEQTNVLEQVRQIWLYVRERLFYLGDGRKDTASRVLKQGHGSCTEYSFSMIALCRANGIPARYISGSITKAGKGRVKSRDTVFHKIVEVYLPRVGWIPMESTAGGRFVNASVADQQIGNLRPRMFFYVHEMEPNLVPIDPRRNTVTWINRTMRSNVKLTGQVYHLWERVKLPQRKAAGIRSGRSPFVLPCTAASCTH